MRKKILILASWYPNRLSPTNGVFIQDQARVLSTEYDVAVLFPQLLGFRTASSMGVRAVAVEQESEWLRIYYEEGRIPPKLHRYFSPLFFDTIVKRGLESVLKNWGKPDLIHAHVVLPGGLGALKVKKLLSRPLVLTEHSGPFNSQLVHGIQRTRVRRTLHGVDRLIAVSPALADQIRSFWPRATIDIVGNVIPSRFFITKAEPKEKDPGAKLRFVCIASLESAKGIDFLLRAARILSGRDTAPFEILIGGDGPQKEQLASLAFELGVSGYCHFLGKLDRAQVRECLQQGDIFVHPSLGETFGVVIGEAMACGLPVVATRCGGPDTLVTEETGFLVTPGDESALAAAMEKMMIQRLRFKPEAIRQNLVRRFGEDAFLNKIRKVYDAL